MTLQGWLDRIAGLVLLAVSAIVIVPWGWLMRLWPRQRARGLRMLQLVSGSIEGEERRNAMGRLKDTDYGWFEHVYHLYFYAPTQSRRLVNERHTQINWRLPRLEALRTAGWKRIHLALHEAAFLVWLCAFLKQEGIAVMDAIDPYVPGVNAYLASRLTGIPYTVEIHRDYDLDYRLLGRPHFAQWYPTWQVERRVGRWVLRHASCVIVDHDCYATYALGNGTRPERLVKVRATSNLGRSGYALAAQPRSDVRDRYGLNGRRLLTYVGRLDPDKFVEDLVPCLAHVVARRQDVRLLLAGDGVLRTPILEAARQQGLADYLRWLGSLPLHDVLDLFASSDVIVGTHLGATYLEAALCGAPLVAYDIDRHPEFIVPGETGLLVPFRHPQQLAEGVLRVLEDAPLADRLRRAAKARVLERHRPEHYAVDMRRCFQALLGTA